MAFKIAGSIGFKGAAKKADPVLTKGNRSAIVDIDPLHTFVVGGRIIIVNLECMQTNQSKPKEFRI